MRTSLLSLIRPMTLLLTVACGSGAQPPPEPEPPPVSSVEKMLTSLSVGHPIVREPTSLSQFVPDKLNGAPATDRTSDDASAGATYTNDRRQIRVHYATMTDVAATRASFELLGNDTIGRVDGVQFHGLRVQGNPAQTSYQLDLPHKATLHVVAANTYLVTVEVTPAESADDAVNVAKHLAISSLTHLAISQSKEPRIAPVVPRPASP